MEKDKRNKRIRIITYLIVLFSFIALTIYAIFDGVYLMAGPVMLALSVGAIIFSLILNRIAISLLKKNKRNGALALIVMSYIPILYFTIVHVSYIIKPAHWAFG